jgi:hypothetical protein
MTVKLLLIAFWLMIWLGGLALGGLRYSACEEEGGGFIPGCDHRLEYLGWAASIFGVVMLARSLMTIPLLKRWFE